MKVNDRKNNHEKEPMRQHYDKKKNVYANIFKWNWKSYLKFQDWKKKGKTNKKSVPSKTEKGENCFGLQK